MFVSDKVRMAKIRKQMFVSKKFVSKCSSGIKFVCLKFVSKSSLHRGLLDVLPERATKYHAIRFLMGHKGFSEQDTVFAGDSGNDLPVLSSSLRTVLVANAAEEVREEAQHLSATRGTSDSLYLARGDFLGMNGNYSAGILEGIAHFLPETLAWMDGSD